ncbi:GIY-YIG nuclease family protein [Mycoplasmopsis agassizii]|uniref:GIY-YIG nuclease family protein n=1 Tax=Mycoplasmopsis agassizii TaxID=33922 RepID=UPI0035290A4A
MNHKQKGYVYILKNPMYKENILKIGQSKYWPAKRAKELSNSSAVPMEFDFFAVLVTSKYKKAEKVLFDLLDELTDRRINKNREFFEIEDEKAIRILKTISVLLDDGEICIKPDLEQCKIEANHNNNEPINELTDDDKDTELKKDQNTNKNKIQDPFNFYTRGLNNGDIVEFIKDSSIKATVSGKNKILYQDVEWTTTGLAQKLLSKKPLRGPEFFSYNGTLLKNLPIVTNNKFDDIFYKNNNELEQKTLEINSGVKTKNDAKKSNRFSFYDKGLKNGDLITFTEDENIKAIIVSEYDVEWNNKIWSTSGLAKELLWMKGHKKQERQGPLYFSYGGVKLKDLKSVKNNDFIKNSNYEGIK